MLAQKVRSMGCEETKRAIMLPSSFLPQYLVIYSSSEHGRVNGKYDFIFGVLPNDHECDLHIRCHVNDFAASKKSFNDTLHLLVLQAICLRHGFDDLSLCEHSRFCGFHCTCHDFEKQSTNAEGTEMNTEHRTCHLIRLNAKSNRRRN